MAQSGGPDAPGRRRRVPSWASQAPMRALDAVLGDPVRQTVTITVAVVGIVAAQALAPGAVDAVVRIDTSTAMQFFSALAQVTASIIGLLIAFYLYSLQAIEQRRYETYRYFRAQTEELLRLFATRPEELRGFDQDLNAVIDAVSKYRLADFPMMGPEDWAWGRTAAGVVQRAYDLSGGLPHAPATHLHQIVVTLENLESAAGHLGVLVFGAIVAKVPVDRLARLGGLLVVALVCLVVFGAVDPQAALLDLRLPTVVAVLLWTVGTVRELVKWAFQMYLELKGPWEHVWPEGPEDA